jgi:molybdopterin-guanine dinucleotide biosynthesis protein A
VSRHPHAFVAACDMPGLDADVIRFLLGGSATRTRSSRAGTATSSRCTRSTRAAAAPAMEASLRAGRHALRDFLGTIAVDYVSEDELARVGGAARSMTNVNTPEELAAVGGRFEDRDG